MITLTFIPIRQGQLSVFIWTTRRSPVLLTCLTQGLMPWLSLSSLAAFSLEPRIWPTCLSEKPSCLAFSSSPLGTVALQEKTISKGFVKADNWAYFLCFFEWPWVPPDRCVYFQVHWTKRVNPTSGSWLAHLPSSVDSRKQPTSVRSITQTSTNEAPRCQSNCKCSHLKTILNQ